MKIPPSLVAPFVGGFYRAWCATLRYEEVNREASAPFVAAGKPLIFALWHDELFALPYKKDGWPIFTVVSRSQDGEYLARLLKSLGLGTLRGSSSRGGLSVLREAKRLMAGEGQCACITVDGPRGPRHQAKDGAVYLAQAVPAHIVAVRLYASRAKRFKSWDRFQLPLPFSHMRIVYGDPYPVRHDSLTPEALAAEREKLQAALEGLI